MSVPSSLRGGPFTPTVLVKKRDIILYIIIISFSIISALLELWLYWPLVQIKPVHFWIFLPLVCIVMYFTMILSSLLIAKLLLLIVNLFHKPRTGIFLRHPSDKDYRYWSLRNTIKRWPIWLSHRFTFPFMDNICLKVFGVKTTFANSLFEGWVDTEFIDFGKNVVVGQGSIIQSATIMGNFLIIKKTTIGENVRIGAHCVVSPGTYIGENSVLGANSITTIEQVLERDWIHIGRPAKKFKKNRFFEDDIEEKIEESQNIDINELRMKYEENFFQRHDQHMSLRERLNKHLDTLKREQERLDDAQAINEEREEINDKN